MLRYPDISPDLLHVGPLRVRWYGLMYVLGFLAGRIILRRLSRSQFLRLPESRVDDLLFVLFISMLIGARMFYMLVYYAPTPDEPFVWWYTPFAVWQGGLAFHGGAIGMMLGGWLFARRNQIPALSLWDALALAAPIGIALGRIGNFINAELYGRETIVPWALEFPIRDAAGTVIAYTSPRHPSQLYEAIGEGLCTLVVVWIVKRRAHYHGMITVAAMAWYGLARFSIEFFREKDTQMPYYFGWLTMGQILCLLMLVCAVIFYSYVRRARVRIGSVNKFGLEPDQSEKYINKL